MQTAIIFSLIVAGIYALACLTINRFTDEKKTLKTISREACVVFLSVIATNFTVALFGLASISIHQKGGATAAFTTTPDF